MSYPTVTNTTSQWTPAGPPLALPAAHPYSPYYHLSDMGRKKKGAHYAPTHTHHATDSYIPVEQLVQQSYRPTNTHAQSPLYPRADSWRSPHDQWRPQHPAQGFSTSLPWRSQPPSRQSNVQSRVSQPTIYSIVDAWRSYKADHDQHQEPAPPSGPASYNVPPSRTPNPPAQQLNQFRPGAPAFQPGQSRYNLRSKQQRPYSTAAAEQIVQSIESEDVQPGTQSSFRKTPSRKPTPRREPTPINTTVTPVTVPQPSTAYAEHAQNPPKCLERSHKLLVLLDLNGTLVYRHGPQRQFFIKRPGVDRLLEYLFENHAVMIFTSATMRSAEKMAHELLSPQQYGELVTIRAREHLGLESKQFYNKVQVYKDLNKIWTVQEVQQSAAELGTKWDMTNTVLIDDSVEKARSHPHNLLQVPEFMHPASNSMKAQQKWTQSETIIMLGVEAKLEELKHRSSVACQIRQWQEGETTSPGVTTEKVDDGKLEAIKEGAVQVDEAPAVVEEPTGYPTPTSMRRDSSTADEDDSEQLQGVKLPTSATEGSSASVKGHTVTSERKGGEVEKEARAMRSPSPITETDFKWRSEGNRAAADW